MQTSSIDMALKLKSDYNKSLTDYVNTLINISNKEKLIEFAEFRNFPLEIINKSGIFYIGDMAEMLLPTFLPKIQSFGIISEANNKPIFRNRYVIPIKDELGKVQNLVGYSADANERYIYGTSEYYRRKDTLWGLENLNMAYKLGYAIITEGITDCIRLRSMGYLNTFAMCGTHKSKFIMDQLNRLRYGIIRIPDRDEAGKKALEGWECNRHLTLNISLLYKDVDEMCKIAENQEWFNSYMHDCIGWLLSEEHNGLKCRCEQVTIM